jgi:hypothetical protein
MARKVLANSPYVYAWAAKEYKQKAAKIVGETIISIINIESGWAEIEKLPVDKDGVGIGWTGYPTTAARWFIADAPPEERAYHEIPIVPVEPPAPPVTPPSSGTPEQELGGAVYVLLRAIKSVFG